MVWFILFIFSIYRYWSFLFQQNQTRWRTKTKTKTGLLKVRLLSQISVCQTTAQDCTWSNTRQKHCDELAISSKDVSEYQRYVLLWFIKEMSTCENLPFINCCYVELNKHIKTHWSCFDVHFVIPKARKWHRFIHTVTQTMFMYVQKIKLVNYIISN